MPVDFAQQLKSIEEVICEYTKFTQSIQVDLSKQAKPQVQASGEILCEDVDAKFQEVLRQHIATHILSLVEIKKAVIKYSQLPFSPLVELQVGFLSIWRKDYWVYLQILQGYLKSSQQQASGAAADASSSEELNVSLIAADFIKLKAQEFNNLMAACLTAEGEIDAELAILSKAPNASLAQMKNAMIALNQITKKKLADIKQYVFGNLSSCLIEHVKVVAAQQNKIKREMAQYKNLVCRQQTRQKDDGYEVVANADEEDERDLDGLVADILGVDAKSSKKGAQSKKAPRKMQVVPQPNKSQLWLRNSKGEVLKFKQIGVIDMSQGSELQLTP